MSRRRLKGCNFTPFIPCKEKSNKEYGFVYTPDNGLSVPPIPASGLVIPGTSIVIPGLTAGPAGGPPVFGAVVPWTSSGVLVQVSRNSYWVRIGVGGDINMQYTFTPTINVTFPAPFPQENIPLLINALIIFRTSLYAISPNGEINEIPGARQVFRIGMGALIGIAFGLLGSVTPPFTFPFVFPLEFVGQSITNLPAGTRIVLAIAYTFSDVDPLITAGALPVLSFVPSTLPGPLGGGNGTLASLEVVREEKPGER